VLEARRISLPRCRNSRPSEILSRAFFARGGRGPAIRGELWVDHEYPWYRSHVPSDVRAYELVKEGFEARWSRGSPTREGLRTAIECYEGALAIDPEYADAHAELGPAYRELATLQIDEEANRAIARAQAERALALDPNNGVAHYLLAQLHRDRYEWDQMRAAVERGLAHNPGNTALRFASSQLLALQGRTPEAIVERRRVADLDPWLWVWHLNLGGLHIVAADYESAVEDLERAWRLAPVRGVAELLSYAYHKSGRDEAALEAGLRNLPPELQELGAAVRRGFEEAGYAGVLRADVAARIATRGDACTSFGGMEGSGALAYLGEADAMFACLEAAIDNGVPLMLKSFDVYDPYRSDPRLTALLQRMNLAE
jgi:protein kinase/serine/threonine-protein kinase